VQSKTLIKSLSAEGLAMNDGHSNDTAKPLDKFLEKLRATYNFVFRQADNASNVKRILPKGAASNSDQASRLIWSNPAWENDYASLKYPERGLLDQVISLSTLDTRKIKTDSSPAKNSSVEMKSTMKTSGSNASSSEGSSNKTTTDDDSSDEDWSKDVQPLGQLELQDEELNNKNEVEILTPGTTLQFPMTVGRQMIEWFGSLFGLTYRIYTKLSSAACSSGNIVK